MHDRDGIGTVGVKCATKTLRIVKIIALDKVEDRLHYAFWLHVFHTNRKPANDEFKRFAGCMRTFMRHHIANHTVG